MSTRDKFEALKAKAKSAFYDLKGEAHLGKDRGERQAERTGERAADALGRAGDKVEEAIDRMTGKERDAA